MMNNLTFKPKKLNAGDFRTPVTFFEYTNKGPLPNEKEKDELFHCFAETYTPSIKDREILNVNTKQFGLTIVIRDPLQSYTPYPNHVVEVDDYRLEQKRFNIYDVRLDTPEKGYITVVLGEK